ncbi:hypothetical protein [Pedobacter sp. UC225_65]|uniref:hypothetical protein n=1 Tax=Pedobacter sp. UC225_65 TaxID=3350173 RepID=UPI003672DBC2
MDQKHVYIEKQYIGRDYIRIAIRLLMAAFCFAAYVYERDRDNTVDFFSSGFWHHWRVDHPSFLDTV